jgi:hypothetical protein
VKRWKDLQFISQVVVKPQDESRPMYVDFREDSEYETWDGMDSEILTSRNRRIQLGANSMFTIHYDYPELFKKLVVATGDCSEAYRIYQQLQKKVPDNWADHTEENVW